MNTGAIENLEIIVLAAGKGTRMRSGIPKVLHELAGEPLLAHVLHHAFKLGPRMVHVVCGHGADEVKARLGAEPVNWILQREQLGTGHAVKTALPEVGDDADVLVLVGDIPLLDFDEIKELLVSCGPGVLALLTVTMKDAQGYGRIVRDDENQVVAIVEEKDASEQQREIREVNTGIIAATKSELVRWVGRIGNRNAQKEYYLTDVVEVAVRDGAKIVDTNAREAFRVLGINTKSELAVVEKHLRRMRAQSFLEQGVTLVDPDRFDARGEIRFGSDCVVDVNVILEGPLEIGNQVVIGPNTVVRQCKLGDGVAIEAQCVIDGAHIDAGAKVGPFSRIRPGAHIGEGVHVGNFVEIKNSELAAGAKVNHLSYVGDSNVGRNVNIGAGVITCNYDGANKHRTQIEDDVSVGSNDQLIAPVTVGKGATIGAGSTISTDVPPGQLALTRAELKLIKGWRRPRKKSSPK